MMSKATFALFFLVAATALVHSESIRSFRPAPINRAFKTVPKSNLDQVLSPKDAALDFAKKQLKLADKDFVVKNIVNTKHNGFTHVYLRQIIDGKEVSNADFNVNVSKDGEVISYGSTFLPITKPLSNEESWTGTTKFVKPAEAFKTLASYMKESVPENISERVVSNLTGGKTEYELTGVPFAQGNVKADQAYIQNEKGELVPSWRFVVKTKNDWLNAHVHADGSKVVAVSNWMHDFSYQVIKLGDSDPGSAERTIVKDPQNKTASPKGWHSEKTSSKKGDVSEGFTTIGNNVYAQENWDGGEDYLENKRPVSKDGNFIYKMDLKKAPKANIDASVTNLFYWNNILHDVSYAYGFDEEAGNFQEDNFDKGGKGGDYVIAHAQDGSGSNNAGFATPPDGEHPMMVMYIFNSMKPNRDGAFVSDIMAHEYTHGISNRLTGGPANTDCLMEFESRSMGEGWGDFLGISLRFRESDTKETNYGVGKWVNNDKSIRSHEYSTDMEVNPLTYASLNEEDSQEVHAGGEIWANTLYEMYWALREATGKFNEDVYSADKTAGNTLALQLVIDAMKIQPCNPTFIQARDAILQAEKAATGEKYKCAIWKAFSKRGMGPKAKSNTNGDEVSVVADSEMPSECGEEGGDDNSKRESKFSQNN